MNASVLVLAGWTVVPYCMAAVAYRLERAQEPQNGTSEPSAALD